MKFSPKTIVATVGLGIIGIIIILFANARADQNNAQAKQFTPVYLHPGVVPVSDRVLTDFNLEPIGGAEKESSRNNEVLRLEPAKISWEQEANTSWNSSAPLRIRIYGVEGTPERHELVIGVNPDGNAFSMIHMASTCPKCNPDQKR